MPGPRKFFPCFSLWCVLVEPQAVLSPGSSSVGPCPLSSKLWPLDKLRGSRFARSVLHPCARSVLSVARLMPMTASPAPSRRPSRMLAAMARRSSVGWLGRSRTDSRPGRPMTIIKTLRLSDALMKKIKAECKTRNLEFSDFMRTAALAAIQRQAKACTHKSPNHVRFRANRTLSPHRRMTACDPTRTSADH